MTKEELLKLQEGDIVVFTRVDFENNIYHDYKISPLMWKPRSLPHNTELNNFVPSAKIGDQLIFYKAYYDTIYPVTNSYVKFFRTNKLTNEGLVVKFSLSISDYIEKRIVVERQRKLSILEI